jgi:hypothetical protein
VSAGEGSSVAELLGDSDGLAREALLDRDRAIAEALIEQRQP